MHCLLAGQITWRRLFPAGLVTAICYTGVGVYIAFFGSSSILSNEARYGPIGAVMTLLTIEVGLGVALHLGAVIGATIGRKATDLPGLSTARCGEACHREQWPFFRRTVQDVAAPLGEGNARSCHQILDGPLNRQAGLEEIEVVVHAPVYPAGHSRRTILSDLVRSLRPMILDLELLGEEELASLDRAVRAHLADPRTLVLSHLLVVAWGRKPPA